MTKYKYTKSIQSVNVIKLANEVFTQLNRRIIKQSRDEVTVGAIHYLDDGTADNLIISLDDPLSPAEETQLNDLVSNHDPFDLAQYKYDKSQSIDDRTNELIMLGYIHDGVTFSLSIPAQTNLLALYTTRNEPSITYPIEYNNIDDSVLYSVPDAATIEAMYLTALGTKKAHLDSGTVFKTAVRNAVDKAGVDAVIDNR